MVVCTIKLGLPLCRAIMRLIIRLKMAAPVVRESEYRLSTELTGHSGDVRAVVDLQTDEGQSVYVVTTSCDKTARVWLREDCYGC